MITAYQWLLLSILSFASFDPYIHQSILISIHPSISSSTILPSLHPPTHPSCPSVVLSIPPSHALLFDLSPHTIAPSCWPLALVLKNFCLKFRVSYENQKSHRHQFKRFMVEKNFLVAPPPLKLLKWGLQNAPATMEYVAVGIWCFHLHCICFSSTGV